jgi:predicted lipid carrier protein YhbT
MHYLRLGGLGSDRITGFYEKVIQVKADVAAVLVLRNTLDKGDSFTAFLMTAGEAQAGTAGVQPTEE